MTNISSTLSGPAKSWAQLQVEMLTLIQNLTKMFGFSFPSATDWTLVFLGMTNWQMHMHMRINRVKSKVAYGKKKHIDQILFKK